MTYGGMKSWRIYERCSINRVQTLNEAKMINKPQKPPCFIPAAYKKRCHFETQILKLKQILYEIQSSINR